MNGESAVLEAYRKFELDEAATLEGKVGPKRKIVAAYKLVLGIQRGTQRWTDWDKFNFARNVRAADSVLAAFEGNIERAVAWVICDGNKLFECGRDFNLNTLAAHAWDKGHNFNGRQNETMDDNLLHGPASDSIPSRIGKQISQAGEILGTSLSRLSTNGSVAVPVKPLLGPKDAANGTGLTGRTVQQGGLPDMGEDMGRLEEDLG